MVKDITKEMGTEEGSAFIEEDLLFHSYQDGQIFNYGPSDYRKMEDMLDRDGKARTLEQCLSLPIRKAPVSLRRGEATPEVTSFVEQALFAPANNGGMTTPMNLIIAQMTSAFVHRKAFFEKVYRTTEIDGKTRQTYEKVAYRPPSTCYIERDPKTGSFKGFKQMPVRLDYEEHPDELFFHPQRAFVYIHGTHRNPLNGVSDLEIAYNCYQTKQKIKFLWYSYLEGQSLPKTVVKARTEQEANRAAHKIAKLRQGGIVGMTEDINLDTLESSGKGAGQFLEALKWLDSEASGSVLAGFTDLGAAASGGTGSFALSKDQTDFFQMSHQAKSTEMADYKNNYLIADLVRLNFGPSAVSPTFEYAPIAEDDAAAAINLLQANATQVSPVLPREFMEELIERVAGFLELDTARVREGLTRAADEAKAQAANNPNPVAEQVAPVVGAVNAATGAVIRKASADSERTRPPRQRRALEDVGRAR